MRDTLATAAPIPWYHASLCAMSDQGKSLVKKGSVRFQHIGDDDQVVYAKADFAKLCFVGPNVALGFYQLDYSAIANAMAGLSGRDPNDIKPMVVAKIVMDPDGLANLKTEIDNLAKFMEVKNASPGTEKP